MKYENKSLESSQENNIPLIDIDAKILTFIPYIEKLAQDTTMRDEVLKMADMIVAAHPNNIKATTKYIFLKV